MTEKEYIKLVIDIAEGEVGYLEKKSNYNLDSKTANAGSANYTKYGRDMHKLYPSVMDFPAAWCDAFVDHCFYKAYGITNAKSLLGGNFDDYTVMSAQLYKNKNAWHKSNPKVGDQIFFTNASGGICHTGLVVGVTSTQVITIEGNTSSASGVVANGGCVRKKAYPLTYSRIAGYGRPAYSKFCTKTSASSTSQSSPSTVVNPSSTSTSLNNTVKWDGKVTASTLNVRTYAGLSNPKCSFSPLKKNDIVGVCDSAKDSKGVIWYYIKYNNKYGFVSSEYIKKITSDSTSLTLNAGAKLQLSKAPLYVSASSKNKVDTKTGVYYIWSKGTVNNRIRITNSVSNVGKNSQITGWINVKDAKKALV